jgi:predicted O-methyltransferase YrrM
VSFPYTINSTRKEVMRKFIEAEVSGKQDFKALEVGTFLGESAKVWYDAIKQITGSKSLTCVDRWEAIYQPINKVYEEMNRVLPNAEEHFKNALKEDGVSEWVTIINGSSSAILPTLPATSFDFIYIDGAHDYNSVCSDIKDALRLIKDKGVICGDDLEKKAGDDSLSFPAGWQAMEYCDGQHVGVSMAVNDCLGNVEVSHGFWWWRK